MRVAWVAAVLIAVVAAVSVLLLQGGTPEEAPVDDGPAWRMGASHAAAGVMCGHCHYGMQDFWQMEWTPGPSAWNLSIAALYPDIPLYAVQVLSNDSSNDGRLERFVWDQGATWSTTVDVPVGAGGLLGKVYGSPWNHPDEAGAVVQMRPNDYVTSLRWVAPDGTVWDAEGPEDDLKLAVISEPAPGTWTLEAQLLGGEAPRAQGTAFTQILNGDVVPLMDVPLQSQTWTFPVADGEPPEVTVWLWPHHDHTHYEHNDWDQYDAVAHVVEFDPTQEPVHAALPWTAERMDALWGDQDQVTFLERAGSRTGAYLDDEGHNDAGVGGSYPNFGPLGAPVWPGTQTVTFELTWEPALERDDLGIRFSPANSPYFYEAEPTQQGPGAAQFIVDVRELWWEDPAGWMPGSDRPVGAWDVAPYVIGEDGSLKVEAIQWELVARAHR